MPKVLAQGKTIECDGCTNLRKVLLHNGIDLYNGDALFINCRGIGTCGTCAVKVEGEVSAANWRSGCTAISRCLTILLHQTYVRKAKLRF
jgi:ferredoxin